MRKLKLFWLTAVMETRIALLRRKYLALRAKEQAMYDRCDCGMELIDILTGGELTRVQSLQKEIGLKAKKIREDFANATAN